MIDMNQRNEISRFVSHLCSVTVGDVSSAEGQCECLLGSITVCLFFDYRSFFLSFYFFLLFRMGMIMKPVPRLG